MDPVLEVCCGSLQSAVNAVAGGAERIELCSALEVDGLTPPVEVLRELRQRFPELKIHVLIRPRDGDFVYTEAEVAQMERDTSSFEFAQPCVFVKQLPGPILCAWPKPGPLLPKLRGQFA